MKEQMLEVAARLRAMPVWVRGLAIVILALLLYQTFLEISHLLDLRPSGSCPDCSR